VIRSISPEGNQAIVAGVIKYGGNVRGPALQAKFFSPSDICIDSKGNIFVADYSNRMIRRISPDGIVSTVVRVGLYPQCLCLDREGNLIILSIGRYQTRIERMNSDGSITRIVSHETPLQHPLRKFVMVHSFQMVNSYSLTLEVTQ
jgi:hypothetical protein